MLSPERTACTQKICMCSLVNCFFCAVQEWLQQNICSCRSPGLQLPQPKQQPLLCRSAAKLNGVTSCAVFVMSNLQSPCICYSCYVKSSWEVVVMSSRLSAPYIMPDRSTIIKVGATSQEGNFPAALVRAARTYIKVTRGESWALQMIRRYGLSLCVPPSTAGELRQGIY